MKAVRIGLVSFSLSAFLLMALWKFGRNRFSKLALHSFLLPGSFLPTGIRK